MTAFLVVLLIDDAQLAGAVGTVFGVKPASVAVAPQPDTGMEALVAGILLEVAEMDGAADVVSVAAAAAAYTETS